jgi:trimethylamine--corrinoid protein Co-methyltransferase
MRHFRTAFYRAKLFDYNSAEQWLIEGGKDGVQRAHETYKRLLKEYEPPALDPAKDEAIKAYIYQRKSVLSPGAIE